MRKIPETLQWFAIGLILSLCVTTAFGRGPAAPSEIKSSVEKAMRECKIAQPKAFGSCWDFSEDAELRKRYEAFAQEPKAAENALAKRHVKLLFETSPNLSARCSLNADVLRSHPEAVGIQHALIAAVESITVDQPRYAEVLIQTEDPWHLSSGGVARSESVGGRLVIRAGLGECPALSTADRDAVRFEITRRLFSLEKK